LLEREFGIYRDATRQFLTTFHHDIQLHHHEIGVINERSHNRLKGRDIQQLKAFVYNKINS
jgi:hypothetical protein